MSWLTELKYCFYKLSKAKPVSSSFGYFIKILAAFKLKFSSMEPIFKSSVRKCERGGERGEDGEHEKDNARRECL